MSRGVVCVQNERVVMAHADLLHFESTNHMRRNNYIWHRKNAERYAVMGGDGCFVARSTIHESSKRRRLALHQIQTATQPRTGLPVPSMYPETTDIHDSKLSAQLWKPTGTPMSSEGTARGAHRVVENLTPVSTLR